MVKKLFKHEFLYYGRIMSIVYLILFTVAAAGRIIQFFESDSVPYEIVFDISCLTYGICAFGTLVFASVLGILRFYRNLFTAEGYLSFTLPVTPAQHIWVKALTAVCVCLISFLMVLVSGCIITAGEMLVEIWKAAVYILQAVWEKIGFHSILIGGEMLLLSVLSLLSGFMLYYTFISIGQLFRKNRILAAVGAFFVYYILTQVFSTVMAVVLSILMAVGALDAFVAWINQLGQQDPYLLVHCSMGLGAVFTVISILIEFLIIRRIIAKKLNLE